MPASAVSPPPVNPPAPPRARCDVYAPSDVVFLVNPHAGTEPPATLTRQLDRRGIAYSLTESKEAVPAFFATTARAYKIIVVCGGDGTVNSVLPYALDGERAFAVYPNGSGDGFAKELGFERDLDGLLAAVARGRTRPIDVMRAGEHYACNVVGVGFDSYVAREFARREERGLKSYVIESTRAYRDFAPIDARVSVDGRAVDGTFQMITVANTPQFGNNARIAPNADASDGLLDVVLVRPMPVWQALRFLAEVFSGREDGSRYVSYHRGREVTIESACPHLQIDGETFPFDGARLEVSVAGAAKWVQV